MAVRRRVWTTRKGEHREAWIAEYAFFTKDGVRKQAIKTFPTQREAKAFRDKTGVDVREGKHVPERASINIREAAEIWFKAVKSGRNGRPPAEASTLRQYRTHIDHHILPELGRVKLSQLSASRVSAFRDHLLARVSRPLAKKVLTSLKSIVGEAQSRDLVAVNAASSVKIQTTNGGRHKTTVEIPEAREIKAVFAVLDERAAKSKTWRRWRAFMATAIHTGLRASELRGLPWDAVDLKAGTLTIKQRADENGKIGSPKSLAGHRTINLPPSLVTLLRKWKAECPPGALVLPNWQGNVESLANIHNRCWKPLQLAAGLTEHVKDDKGNVVRDEEGMPVKRARYNFHCLRHFHASRLIADGANAKEVQAEMGHSNITVTLDLYAHLFKDEEADQRRKERAERIARF